MDVSAKYTALDHSAGLEVVEPSEAPEVVNDGDLPNTAAQQKSSLLKPEPYLAAHYASSDKYYRTSSEEDAPEHDDPTSRIFIPPGAKGAGVGQDEISGARRREKRYCCGLTRRVLISLMVAIILVVLVGVVLGGVLGALLNKKSKPTTNTTSLQTLPNTGLASVLLASNPSTLLTYYQDPEGRIIENIYNSNTWTLSDRTNINNSIVTTAATPGSPLAAISYNNTRQVFFISPTGAIMTTNSTKTLPGSGISTSWSVPYSITTDTVAPNSVGLAACWSDGLMNGIRVYYPSQWGWIIESKYTFGKDGWIEGQNFDGSDAGTGVACATAAVGRKQYINVYMRFVKSGLVKQIWNNYSNTNNTSWDYSSGPQSWANETIAAGSDIAIASDDSQTEYVYYQLEGGTVARGIVNPSLNHYDTFDNFTLNAAVGTKLAAAFIDGGSMVMFQNKTSGSTIWTDNVSRYGTQLGKGVVPRST